MLYVIINTSGRCDIGFVYTGFTVYSTTEPFFKCRPISFSIFLIVLRLTFLACGRRLSRCPGPPYPAGIRCPPPRRRPHLISRIANPWNTLQFAECFYNSAVIIGIKSKLIDNIAWFAGKTSQDRRFFSIISDFFWFIVTSAVDMNWQLRFFCFMILKQTFWEFFKVQEWSFWVYSTRNPDYCFLRILRSKVWFLRIFPQFFVKVFAKVGWKILCFLCRKTEILALLCRVFL